MCNFYDILKQLSGFDQNAADLAAKFIADLWESIKDLWNE